MKTSFNIKSIEQASASRAKNMIRTIEAVENSFVSVGFFPDSVYPDGTPIAAVAMWNNNGTETIPERPFFTKGILIGRMAAGAINEELLSDVILGNMTIRNYLEAIGNTYQDSIVQAIDSDLPPPNAPSTWEKKMMMGLKQTGKKKFRQMKSEGRDYLEILRAMDEKYESGKSAGKSKYKTGSGSSKTLIDRGFMRKAVSYRVEEG